MERAQKVEVLGPRISLHPSPPSVPPSWIILYHCRIISYYIILYYIVLVLYYIILYYIILYYTILYYTILYYVILYYSPPEESRP